VHTICQCCSIAECMQQRANPAIIEKEIELLEIEKTLKEL